MDRSREQRYIATHAEIEAKAATGLIISIVVWPSASSLIQVHGNCVNLNDWPR